jgi:DGQHR domain-containing protein
VVSPPKFLERRAIRVDQNAKHPLYLFTLKAKEILQVAQISRVGRSQDGSLIGYQRPEVREHIRGITEYLNSPDVIFPNSIILAFDSRVTFVRSRGPRVGDGLADSGVLHIPINGRVPGWIVDGQQRATALARSSKPDFPVPVNAFIADQVALQRDQFLRVNNTKPLPSGLISELLPEVDTLLPPHLSARRLPSALVDVLNHDPESPLRGLIRRTSTAKDDRAKSVITDTSLISAIEESLTTPSGCLYSFRNLATGETESDEIKRVLFLYWAAVRDTFPDAWAKSPKQSRLMHGAGIRAMGRVMDHVMRGIDPSASNARHQVMRALDPLKRMCRWTSGNWDELDGLAWNEVQNLPRHVQLLSSVLVRVVLARGAVA